MRHAILIGCEKYKNFSDTRFAHADVDLFYETLTEFCDFRSENILKYKLSKDSSMNPKDLAEGIESFSAQTGSGNTILFYFAGHGHQSEDDTYLILPSSTKDDLKTSALKLDEVASKLRQEEKTCIRVFDACHSGTDVRDASEDVNSDEFLRSITSDTKGWVTLAGCAPTQKSHMDPQLGHGIFTYFLCEQIKEVPAGERVYPESLKVPVVEKVIRHAEKLGFQQTPTLNGSIIGNITIATRKKNSEVSDDFEEKESPQELRSRIVKLNSTQAISSEYLEELLADMATECLEKFKNIEFIDNEGENSGAEYIEYIPDFMQEKVIGFASKQGYTSMHTLESEKIYKPRSILDTAFVPRELIRTDYLAEQSRDLPESTMEIRFKGDSRCIPHIVVLLYVIPLQITTCNLVGVWNYGWSSSDEPKLIRHYYENRKCGVSKEIAASILSFAAEGFSEMIQGIVEKRTKYLERELSDAS